LQGESERFSEINALRVLAHLVGDVHQPLHVGCGFIDDRVDPPKLAKDPQSILENSFESDSGGNAIALPRAGKLHSYWDSGLGGLIDTIDLDETGPGVEADHDSAADEETKARLIEQLYQEVLSGINEAPANIAADEILVIDWAEQWANDSLIVAREAYKTFKITEKIVRVMPNGQVDTTYKVSWEGKAQYNQRCAPFLRTQMALAARHLAEMLNSIYS
jgi:hypothetical protein